MAAEEQKVLDRQAAAAVATRFNLLAPEFGI
jgi:hypothetical protein